MRSKYRGKDKLLRTKNRNKAITKVNLYRRNGIF